MYEFTFFNPSNIFSSDEFYWKRLQDEVSEQKEYRALNDNFDN